MHTGGGGEGGECCASLKLNSKRCKEAQLERHVEVSVVGLSSTCELMILCSFFIMYLLQNQSLILAICGEQRH